MISKLIKFARKTMEWAEAQIVAGKKKAKSNSDWLKLTGFALAAVLVGVILVGVICAGVLLLIALPGIILGAPVWFGWTYLGFGAHFFPTLDPVWLTITYGQFVFFIATFCWVIKFIRGKRSQAGSIKSADGSWELRK